MWQSEGREVWAQEQCVQQPCSGRIRGRQGAQEGQDGRGRTRLLYTLGEREVASEPGMPPGLLGHPHCYVEGGLWLGGLAALWACPWQVCCRVVRLQIHLQVELVGSADELECG